MDILSIGDNCIDVYVNKKLAFPGGGCVNFSVYSSRAGANSYYCGALGKDKAADILISSLNKENVNTKYAQFYSGKTALAFVKLEQSERTFIGSDNGIRYKINPNKISLDKIKKFDLIHTTLDGEVDTKLSTWSKLGCLISYDFSHRAKSKQIELLPYIDYAFFSGSDLELDDIKNRAKHYYSMSSSLIIFTLGSRGSLVYDGQKFYSLSAKKIKPVDTLGCGDSFMASFAVEHINSGSITRALESGTNSASKTLKHLGAYGHGINLNELNINISQICTNN